MNIKERKQKWVDFYEGKTRALVIIEQADYGVRPIPTTENMDAFFNWSVRRYQVMKDSLEWLDDDRIPFVW